MSASEQIARQFANSANVRKVWGDIIVNVKEYGAIGNGVIDDTQAIQNAVNAAVGLGKSDVWFPAGTYKYTTLANTSGISFYGDGVTLSGTTVLDLLSFHELSVRIDNIVASAGDSNTEIVDARLPDGGGPAYTTLKERLDTQRAEIILSISSEEATRADADDELELAFTAADNALSSRIDNLVISATGGNVAEVVDARYDAVNDITYTVLKDRLDASAERLANYTAFYDLNNMKNNRVLPLTFNSDSGHFSTYTGDKAVNGIMEVDSAATSGFVVNVSDIYSAYLKLNMPIGVAIGDSIIAGHPAEESELENGRTPSIEFSGTIPFHIEEYAKIKVYNHGIGGERLDQFRTRWNRDVLAQTDLVLTPTSTLPKKPIFVIIGTGINDVFLPRTAADMITDIEWMIDSAIDNDIYPIVINCGPHGSMDASKLAVVKAYNAWLVTKANVTPNLTVIDFYTFANDPGNDGKPQSGIFADLVHPKKVTYQRLTKKIIDEAFNDSKPATIPSYLNISTAFNLDSISTTLWRPVAVLLLINDKPMKFVQLKNTPNQVIKLPAVDEVMETITIKPYVAEVPTELPSNTYTRIFFSEVYLSDRNLYPSNMLDKDCNIDEVPAVSGINALYPAIPDSTDGQFTFTATASDANWTGVFANVTAGSIGYLCNRGICVIKPSGTMYVGDYIATSTAGNFTRNNTAPAASIKGKVLKVNTGSCLVELF